MAETRLFDQDKLPIGAKRVVKVGDVEVLLIHHQAGFAAVESKCPHAGAPLEQGAVCNGRLICPWHMATFALPTGELIEPPAMAPLKTYAVILRDGAVIVDIEAKNEHAPSALPASDDSTFLIIGAGAAGSMAAVTLRQNDFAGRVVVIDPVRDEPIDRTQLSKDSLAGKFPFDKLPLAPFATVNTERVDARLVSFSAERGEATLDNGNKIRFDRALIATGGEPKSLDIPGAELAHNIRHTDDVKKIHEAVRGKREVAVLGGSFIALEAASALTDKGLRVTVVARESLPFEKQFGQRVAKAIQQLHESHGTQFRLGVEILQINMQGVEIREGDRIEMIAADAVIAGVGVQPALSFEHDLPLSDKGGIAVDQTLRAAANVWVAGDIASVDGVRIEHWRVAQQHGRIASLAMAECESHHSIVPFFWTYHFGKRFDYLGRSEHWDDIVFDGEPENMRFIAFYLRHREGEQIVEAVLSCDRESETALLAELMRTPLTLSQARKAIA
jgi:NADPH-dependent 2,4-dienoyl-CoA reductase/sulfur reductase-like enzyme/nitrite reductase/ring-hydroxylating ferredoxin subunit